MMIHSKLILYRNFENKDIMDTIVALSEAIKSENIAKPSDRINDLYDIVERLILMAQNKGYEGNLWHMYLTDIIANNENAYSMATEIRGSVEGSVNEAALNDFAIFEELFKINICEIDEYYDINLMNIISEYKDVKETGKMFNQRVCDRICDLAKVLAVAENAQDFKAAATDFYKEYGVGRFGLHKAFRIEHDDDGNVNIVPITNIAHVYLEDLVGYEIPKQKLIDNTEAFVCGRRANNCLLFGDAGTGKSSSIKGIMNKYYDRGLRIIEIYKHQFRDLNEVIRQIKNRNYKFILYMDDLSFEDFEIEYKYLKAVIEGGLEKKPDNILIYATSNRRHLVKENFADKEDKLNDELHRSDTVQEKLSLYSRFGVSIFFCAPNKKEFNNIVKVLAERYNVSMPEDELIIEANKWELSHGGLSGRTASQFIDYLLGKKAD